jgi:intracellular multiplication protein IcmD
MIYIKKRKLFKILLTVLTTSIAFYASCAYADQVTDIKSLVAQVTSSFQSLGMLMAATAYLSGFGMVIASLFKFKQHKENPQQIPMGTAIAMLVVGVSLIFLPGFVGPAGQTLFGTDASSFAGGYTGAGAKKLPGGGS